MNEEPEIIDSTDMEILSEFAVEYDEAELESTTSANMKNCFIKASDAWVVFAADSKGSDEAVGEVAFERGTFRRLTEELDAVLAGKLHEEKSDASTFKNGRDEIVVGASSNLPLNRLAWTNRINISNLREIELDDLEYGQMSLPVEAARKLHEEMKRLIAEGKI